MSKTYEDALAELVAQDVARWGEGERAASREQHSKRSYGRLLNELAARGELADAPGWRELREAAEAMLTDADWRELRQGG